MDEWKFYKRGIKGRPTAYIAVRNGIRVYSLNHSNQCTDRYENLGRGKDFNGYLDLDFKTITKEEFFENYSKFCKDVSKLNEVMYDINLKLDEQRKIYWVSAPGT